MNPPRKERLGRGLEVLLGDYLEQEPDTGAARNLKVDTIRPNPFQPRRDFPPEELDELARSIHENGLLQPLLVRPSKDERGGRYELVAGERRLRAVRQLGWKEISAVIREVDDRTLLVLALVENLQREALGALEEAEGYRVLIEDFGLTQGEIAGSVGKDRSTVANTLRLLKLPPSVRKLLEKGDLSVGHARALLGLENPVRAGELARQATKRGWSVRQIEDRIRAAEDRKAPRKGNRGPKDPVVRALEEEIRATLGTRATVRIGKGGKGVIEIPYHSSEDFERLFQLIVGREASDVVS